MSIAVMYSRYLGTSDSYCKPQTLGIVLQGAFSFAIVCLTVCLMVCIEIGTADQAATNEGSWKG